MSLGRGRFARLKELDETGGEVVLMEISRQTPLLKNRISLEGEAIMSMAVAQLLWVKGQWPMCISNGDSEHLADWGHCSMAQA